jgi:AcrR family transcriptional regulator
VSPKKPDQNVRMALIEHAARMTAEEGSQALTLRRLTSAVGVSTMAVYTHFGGMDDLRRAIRGEGFRRLAARMEAVVQTDDPVADLIELGWAYHEASLTEPNLYRAMFMEKCVPDPAGPVGLDTFARLVASVSRCIDAGRFRSADPVHVATQLWVTQHGIVTLTLAGYLTDSEAITCLTEVRGNLLRSFAEDPDSVEASQARALESRPAQVESLSP